MNVAAYLRVSTKGQEDGLGLDVQEQGIRTWAKAEGHKVTEWHTDTITGKLEDRPALADALDATRSQRVGGLVVYRLDRLARDLIVQETLLVELWRHGAQVFSTAKGEAPYLTGDDPDDPSRKLIRQVLGAVAEYERALIALRLRSGRRRKAERGGYAYGSPPVGYQSVDGVLVPQEREQAALRRIRELHAAGKSLREIGALLEVEGHRPKRAEHWHPHTLSRLLARSGDTGTAA